MAKNLMREVAKLLGVEIDEKFRLRDIERDIVVPYLYYFSEADGLMCINANGEILTAPLIVNGLLGGKYKVVKLPWEPKEGDKYYSISLSTKSICVEIWHNETSDYALKALDMIYRSAEEAEANLSKDYERLTGKPLNSR